MSEAPCKHYDQLAGTISAGDIKGRGAFYSVATCLDCVTKSAGFVQMMTGFPANPFEPYP